MAHDGHDRRPRQQFRVDVGRTLQPLLHVVLGDALHPVAELLHHQLGGVGVERLRDRRHHAHAHQRLDHVGRARGHAVGEFLHGDRVRQHDLAHDLQPDRSAAAPVPAWRRSRSRWRRTEARLRTLSSSPSIAACTSIRPERLRRSSPPFFGAATGGLRGGSPGAPPGRRTGRDSSSSSPGRAGLSRSVSVGADGVRRRCRAGLARAPRRRCAACSRQRRRGGSRLGGGRRRGTLVLRLGAGVRPPPRSSGARLLLGGLARLLLAPTRLLGGGQDRDLLLLAALGLALGRLTLLLDQRSLAGRQARWRSAHGRRRPAGGRWGRGRAWRRRSAHRRPHSAAAAARRPPDARFLRTSTCTTLERPWLKLCRTDPASTVRPSFHAARRAQGKSALAAAS